MKTTGLGGRQAQHSALCQHLRQAAANISLLTALLGVSGTIYSPYSMEPLKNLGLDPQISTKLAMKLHSVAGPFGFS